MSARSTLPARPSNLQILASLLVLALWAFWLIRSSAIPGLITLAVALIWLMGNGRPVSEWRKGSNLGVFSLQGQILARDPVTKETWTVAVKQQLPWVLHLQLKAQEGSAKTTSRLIWRDTMSPEEWRALVASLRAAS